MLKGLDLTKPYHWFYLVMLAITPIVVLVGVFTLLVGGWFLLLFWWWIMSEVVPDEVEEARNRVDVPEPRPVTVPRNVRIIPAPPPIRPQHSRHLWMQD